MRASPKIVVFFKTLTCLFHAVALGFVLNFSFAAQGSDAQPVEKLSLDEVTLLILGRGEFRCSGILAKDSAGKTFLVSAAHCLPGGEGFIDVISPRRDNTIDDVGIPTGNAEIFFQQDIFSAPLPSNTETGYKIKTLAAADLQPGSEVILEGFPDELIQKEREVVPFRIHCVYVGPALSYLANSDISMVSEMARCPAIGDAGGLSGGPVSNRQGEVIGVVSASMKKPSPDVSYIFFNTFMEVSKTQSMTQKNLPVVREDGLVSFPNFRLGGNPEKQYQAKFTFQKGLLQGPFTLVPPGGGHVEGNFLRGKLQGEYREYDRQGHLTDTSFYSNGKEVKAKR